MTELNIDAIKKALKCHSDEANSCAKCPYNKEACSLKLAEDALSLINELTGKLELYKVKYMEKQRIIREFDEKVDKLTAENEKLKAEIEYHRHKL